MDSTARSTGPGRAALAAAVRAPAGPRPIGGGNGVGARSGHLPPPPPPGPIARVMSANGGAAATAPANGGPGALAAPGRAMLRSRTAVPIGPGRIGLPLPPLRRNVCPHFYMTGPRGTIPVQAPHLLKALMRQESNVCRCQLRGGVHLEQGYVGDICLSPRFNQCVFYEDDLTRR